MGNVLKNVLCLLAALIMITVCSPCVFAQSEKGANDDSRRELNEKIRERLDSGVPKDIAKTLEKEKIKIDSPESFGGIKPQNVFESLWSSFKDAVKKPFRLLGKMAAISLISAFIGTLTMKDKGLGKVSDIICLMTTVMVLIQTVKDTISSVHGSIKSMNYFLTAYLPVFSGITAAGGNVIGSNGYSAIMMFVCELMGIFASNILFPLISICLALNLVSSINSRICFEDISAGIKKAVAFSLGLSMTILTGLMGIQGVVGASVENMSSKAVKFAASSFIPVVGSSVSEAYSTVKGSLGVIRSTVGSIGVIVLIIIASKPIITLLAVKLMVFVSTVMNDALGCTKVSKCLKSVNSTLSLAVGTIVAYVLVFTVSTAILMFTAFNIGG